MQPFARPRLVVSRCLELDPVRYNGQSIRARIVSTLAPWVELLPVCPEVEIGLGVPRPAVRLVAVDGETRMVQPETGRDLTGEMRDFGERWLTGAGEVDGFLLKGRSPTCGIKGVRIYASAERSPPIGTGTGLFAEEVLTRFPEAAVEEEGRLTNFRIRHHFLTRLFALAGLREVQASGSMARLVELHASHKLLLMAHGEAQLRVLGRVVANAERAPFADVARRYRIHFALALARPARPGPNVNALSHAVGYFSEGLSAAEKRHWADLVAEYRAGRMPLSALLSLVQSWIVRFGEPYLTGQRLLEPYPSELTDLRDSGGDSPAA